MTFFLPSAAAHPVKIISRNACIKRKRKLYAAYCVVTLAFSIGCTSALTPLMHQAPVVATNTVPAGISNIPQMPVAAVESADNKPLEAIIGAAPKEQIVAGVTAPQLGHALNVNVKMHSGDTLGGALTKAGVGQDDARNIIESVRKVYDIKRLDTKQTIALTFEKDSSDQASGAVSSMILPVSALSTVNLTRNEANGFAVKKVDAPLERRLVRAGGRIENSFYETGLHSGIPASLLEEIISAYSYDIDFQRDVKHGDAVDVLFERMQTKEGIAAGHSNIIFAKLDLGDQQLKIFRYTDVHGVTDYYGENGESIRKALLKTPINGARITSGFGARFHPLLGYTRMHRGVDFGAPIGTPIYAAGDGTVEFVGRKNGFGNYLKLKHNDTYASAYAHISRFAAGVAPGRKVKQGQIIAYVGMSGMATGPHLHYEILVNNEQVNPANVRFKTGNILAGKELSNFHRSIAQAEAQLAAMPRNNALAMADVRKKSLED